MLADWLTFLNREFQSNILASVLHLWAETAVGVFKICSFFAIRADS